MRGQPGSRRLLTAIGPGDAIVGCGDYLYVIWHRKWPIVTAALVAALIAAGASVLQPRAYRGEATMLITEKAAEPSAFGSVLDELFGLPGPGVRSQMRLMQRPPVAERAILKLGLSTTPEDLMKRVTVSAVWHTDQVTLAVTDSAPGRATADAVALATSYVEWARDLKRAGITSAAAEASASMGAAMQEMLAITTQMGGTDSAAMEVELNDATAKQAALIETLVDLRLQEQSETDPAALASTLARVASTERQLADLRARIEEIGTRLGSPGDQSENPGLQARLQAATARYTTLSATYEALKVAEQRERGPATFVSSEAPDAVPVAPAPVRDGALGLLAGLALGLGVVLVVKRPDETVRSPEEAERIFGAPLLGAIPAEYLGLGEPHWLAITQRPGSHAAGAYSRMRENLEFVNFQRDLRTVVVAAAAPAEGKSTVAANLAASLALAGARVVLVNCDFRSPATSRFFKVNDSLGLSDVLSGRMPLGVALQATDVHGLRALVCGRVPPNPSAMLGSRTMTELVAALEATHDWVIVDSPPLLTVADAAATVRWADGVLLVTCAGVSTRPAAANARDLLAKVRARTLGVVVWGVKESGVVGRERRWKLADAGAVEETVAAPAEHITGEFTMPEDRAPHRLAEGLLAWLSQLPAKWLAGWPSKWQSGWRLWLLVAMAVLLLGAVIVANGWFGTSRFLPY